AAARSVSPRMRDEELPLRIGRDQVVALVAEERQRLAARPLMTAALDRAQYDVGAAVAAAVRHARRVAVLVCGRLRRAVVGLRPEVDRLTDPRVADDL